MKINKEKLKQALEQASKNTNLKTEKDFSKEEQAIIENWKASKPIKIDVSEFNTAKELIKVTLKGFSTATLLFGEGGVGKSLLTIETVKEELKNNEWEYKRRCVTA